MDKIPKGDTWYPQNDTANDESHIPVDHQGNAKTTDNMVIQNIDIHDVMPVTGSRVTSKDVIPVAVKARLLGNLITDVPSQSNLVLGAAAVVPNSTSINFLFSIADPGGREVFVMPLIGFYVAAAGSQTFSAADAWPNATYGMGNCPVAVFNDLNRVITPSQTISNNCVVRATLRNNTGASVVVLCEGKFRIIANPTQGTASV